jgi:hypothetical protein
MNYQYLTVGTKDRVGWIKYNRPPINAFNWEMLREVPAALKALLKDPKVRVIVFASAIEKYFSTGADLQVFDGIGTKGMEEWVSICHGLVTQMRRAKTKEIYDDIKLSLGIDFVPNMYKVMASKPGYLEANWNKIKTVMQEPGKLDSLTKEIIAVAVSAVMGCQY